MNKLDPESESPTTERLGRIYLHHVRVQPTGRVHETLRRESDEEGDSNTVNAVDCSLAEKLECAAVLDMKWREADLAVATAGGQLQIYSYEEAAEEPAATTQLLTLSTRLDVTEGLALALGRPMLGSLFR